MGILLTTFATIGSLSRPLPSFDGILIFFPHPGVLFTRSSSISSGE
jgi:hypothetical protein